MIETNTGDGASLFTTEAPVKIDMPSGKPLACPAGTRFAAYKTVATDGKLISHRWVVMVLLHEGERETAESTASLLRKIAHAEGRQRLKSTLTTGILVGVIAGVIAGVILEIARRFIVPIWP